MEVNVEKYIKGCLQNDPRSQELFYKHCFKNLLKISLRYHSNYDDAVSSFNKAMMKALTKLSQYRGDGTILGWVAKIITTTCLNELRARSLYTKKEVTEDVADSFSITPEVYKNTTEKELLNIICGLPDATRIVFNLFVMEGYSHKEISKELKISEGTSKWHLNNARKMIKEKFYNLNNA